jgi:hypothetical protein
MADNDKPLLPPDKSDAGEPLEPNKPQAGQQWMVKHPSINGQWQPATIEADTADPQRLFARFADGTAFSLNTVELGGPIDQSAGSGAAPAVGETAQVSPLNPEYEAFRKLLVELNGISRGLFHLPLGALLVMVSRYANAQESPASGIVATYGGDITTFTPDQPTFDKWLENYLVEIQRREAGKGSAE